MNRKCLVIVLILLFIATIVGQKDSVRLSQEEYRVLVQIIELTKAFELMKAGDLE